VHINFLVILSFPPFGKLRTGFATLRVNGTRVDWAENTDRSC